MASTTVAAANTKQQVEKIASSFTGSLTPDHDGSRKRGRYSNMISSKVVKRLCPTEQNPKDWPAGQKWTVLTPCLLCTTCSAINASTYPVQAAQGSLDLNVSETTFLVGNTAYLLAIALAPLILAPLSENHGRTPYYVISSLFFVLLFLPQILSNQFAVIVVCRFLQGILGSTGNSMVAGTIGDLFLPQDRGLPLSVFVFSVFAAQGIFPTLASLTIEHVGWRSVMWWNMALSSTVFVAIFLTIKETRTVQELKSDTTSKSTRSLFFSVYQSVGRPVSYLLFEPIVTGISLWVAFMWGIVFVVLEAIPAMLAPYGLSVTQSLLPLTGLALGALLGVAWQWWNRNRGQTQKQDEDPSPSPLKIVPETRLPIAVVAGLTAPAGLFILAWTARKIVSLAVPIIGLTIFNVSLFPIFFVSFIYLSDCYGTYSSSAIAAQSALRNIFSATFPLFTPAFYIVIRPAVATSILAAVMLVLGLAPLCLLWWGPHLRSRSRACSEICATQDPNALVPL